MSKLNQEVEIPKRYFELTYPINSVFPGLGGRGGGMEKVSEINGNKLMFGYLGNTGSLRCSQQIWKLSFAQGQMSG